MRIAFYAPMKPASSPVPSGDREMARNLLNALGSYHDVNVASEFVSRDGKGEHRIQRRIAERGAEIARELISRWANTPRTKRPDAWFTYHVYHKAPDWLGPIVSTALKIPYFLAEVSHAPKQAGGPWDIGYRSAENAIKNAQGIFGLSRLDKACVLPLLDDPSRYHRLAPFTDVSAFAEAARVREKHRKRLIAAHNLPPAAPILMAVGMMREGDKLSSYRVLADALCQLRQREWSLLIVGDGPARDSVEGSFKRLPADRIRFMGSADCEQLPALYAGADLLTWPAVNEAFGMAMLEAQAAGLPVIAGKTGGVPDVVHNGETGVLCPVGNASAFAGALAGLLDTPSQLKKFSKSALTLTASENDISNAARTLDSVLRLSQETKVA